MTFRLILFGFVLVFTVTAFARSNGPKRDPSGKPIYEIKKGNETAYIFGVLRYGLDYNSIERFIKNEANNAKTIVLETDMVKLQQSRVPQKAKSNLKLELTQSEWKLLSGVSKLRLGSMEAANNLTTSQASSLYDESCSPETPKQVELHLQLNAKQNNQTIVFLQDFESYNKLLEEVQTLEYLKRKLNVPRLAILAKTREASSAYYQGNMVEFEKYMIAEAKESSRQKEEFEKLYTKRNLVLVDKFDEIFNKSGVEFVAINIKHLLGEGGMINILKSKGYEVRRFYLSPQGVRKYYISQ